MASILESILVPHAARHGKQAAKWLLRKLQSTLPHAAYVRIYEPTFALYRRGLELAYAHKVRGAERRGEDDLAARGRLILRVMPHSLVGTGGLEQTYDHAAAIVDAGIEGAFVECGVAEGGCAAMLATQAAHEGRGRPCWFFDSFEGLPEPTAEDYAAAAVTGDHVRPLPKGSCLGTIEQVEGLLFDDFGLPRGDVRLVKGWFQDTLQPTAPRIGPIALLRIDGDWYDSTRCCLETLYDAVAPGGAVIIDDYGTCHGCKRATDEFLHARALAVELVDDGRGGVSFVKPRPAA